MLSKLDFEKLIQSIRIPYAEGIQHMEDNDKNPRIVYFETTWETISASGCEYDTKVTYQVSFFSSKPRDNALLNLRKELSKKDIKPVIYHEYLKPKRTWHSFFTIEVLENIHELL